MSDPNAAGDLPAGTPAQNELLQNLFRHRLLIPSGVPGLYGRGGEFEDVIERFDDLITRAGAADKAERVRFPPVINRKHFEKSQFLNSMPQLAGAISSFKGNTAEHADLVARLTAGQEWGSCLAMTDVVLTPAACYPVYPAIAAQGPLPATGRLMDVYSYCFRHEPSPDPARMQIFRMREYVRLSPGPDGVKEWRDAWVERGLTLLGDIGLNGATAPANDPFFGRGGKMLAANQREQKLKFELSYPITSEEKPTALLSFNYHQDHFATIYGLTTLGPEPVNTACVGFGMERVALALFKAHGFETSKWPQKVRARLWP